MRRHLTEDEIVACVAEPDRKLSQHLAECHECGQQVTILTEALHGFRSSASAWADAQRPVIRTAEPKVWWIARPQWTIALLTVLTLVAIPVYRQFAYRPAPQGAQRVTARMMAYDNEADAALLRTVDAHISRSVPAPMEPLLSLVQGN